MKKQTLNLLLPGVLLLLTSSLSSLAQVGISNTLGLPSANNTFLGKGAASASVGVDLYTGTAQVSIPLCNLPSRDLDIPISLNYVDGRGVKVQEYASQVGLGWQLSAGGSVSRVVRGFPDEQSNGYLGPNHYGQAVTPVAQNPSGITPAQFSEFITSCSSFPCNNAPTADGEPDLYSVQTPFFSFQFAFDPNTGKPAFSNYNGYQVIPYNFVSSTNIANSYFEVIDGNGNQFYFGSQANSVENTTDSIYGKPITFPTSWYLNTIVTHNNRDIINLTYTAGPQPVTTYNYFWSETLNYLAQYNVSVSTGKSTLPSAKYVSTIVSSQGELDFSYAFDRSDLSNAGRLTQITVKALNPLTGTNSTLVKTYSFLYDYFKADGGNPILLQLAHITLSDGVSTDAPLNLFTFAYNTSMPAPLSQQPYFDYWGYAIPTPSPSHLGNINRNPVLSATQTDVLTNITSMEGATWNIYYDLNTYGPGINAVGGLRVSKLERTLPTGESLNTQYFYLDPNNSANSTGQIYNSNYTNLFFTLGASPQIDYLYISNSPFITSDLTGNFVGYSCVKVLDQNGGYTYNYFSNFNDPNCSDVSNIGGSAANNLSGLPMFSNWTNRSYKRGLLMKQVTYNSANAMTSQIVNNYNGQGSLSYQAWGLHPLWLTASTGQFSGWNIYNTPIENYRLTSSATTVYDQVSGQALTTTVNYGYDALNWQVHTTTTADSKGATHTQFTYFPYDAGIPDLASGEQAVLNNMVAQNAVLPVIHTKDIRNSTTQEVHNTYIQNTTYNFIYLAGSAAYLNGNMIRLKSFVYDPVTSNLLTTVPWYGKPSGAFYGYNNSLLTAGLVNAQPSEAFFEGFEENSSATTGAAHSGNAYLNGNYTVNFYPQSGRQCLIQWWNLGGGTWNFNQQNYTAGMTLTGPVDDVRVFPSDAQMTTYTYSPLVGQTSITDPAGKTFKTKYDAFSRVKLKLDQDNNILEEYAYTYSSQAYIPYVRMSFQNVVASGAYTTGDFTVNFYSDPACTQPLSVSNLPVSYNVSWTCQSDDCAPFSGGSVYTTTVSGSSAVLIPGAFLSNPSTCNFNGTSYDSECNSIFSLIANSKYIIAQ